MKTIRIPRHELIEHLTRNRDNHVMEYREAMVAYRDAMELLLKELLKKANNDEDINHHLDIVRPEDYTKFYDEILLKLKWTLDNEIELDHAEFKMYVQDEWGWSQSFKTVTSSYTKRI